MLRLKEQFEFTDLFLSKSIWQKVRKPVITTFFFFHFICIFLYFHIDHLLISKALEPVNRYYFFIGMEQAFNVFAPSPVRNNFQIITTITYRDGTTVAKSFPHAERMTLTEKLFRERFRKFLCDNLALGRITFLAPDIARFVARENNTLKDNPPEVVSLMIYNAAIPPIENGLPEAIVKLHKELDAADAKIQQGQLKKPPKVPRSTHSFNSYGNRNNPPLSASNLIIVYPVKQEDLE